MAVSAEVRRNAALVVVAGAVFFGLQAVVSGFARPLSESELRALYPSAPRLLGLIRLLMMALTTGAMVIAYRTWVRPAARVSWAAAAAFAVSWGPLYFGPEVRPYAIAALGCVAAGGFATRWLVERERSMLVALCAAVAVVVALRPLAGGGLVLALVAVTGVWARRESLPPLLAVAVGAAVGWVAGVVGLVGRVAGRVLPADVAPPPLVGGLQELLVALQRPFPQAEASTTPVYAAVAVLGVLAVALALAGRRWAHRRNAAMVGLTLALGLLIPPVAINRITAAELLPAYAAVTIPLGAGILGAWDATRRVGSALLTAVFFVLLAGLVVWQLTLAAGANAEATQLGGAREAGLSRQLLRVTALGD